MPRKVSRMTDRFDTTNDDGVRYAVVEMTDSYVSTPRGGRSESLMYKTYRLDEGGNVIRKSASEYVVEADGMRLTRIKTVR